MHIKHLAPSMLNANTGYYLHSLTSPVEDHDWYLSELNNQERK